MAIADRVRMTDVLLGVDSLGLDWMQQTGMPTSPSDRSSPFGSGNSMVLDKQPAQAPEALASDVVMKCSKNTTDAMHDSSPLQWPLGASEAAAAQLAFFPLDPVATDDWTDPGNTLVTTRHPQHQAPTTVSGTAKKCQHSSAKFLNVVLVTTSILLRVCLPLS